MTIANKSKISSRFNCCDKFWAVCTHACFFSHFQPKRKWHTAWSLERKKVLSPKSFQSQVLAFLAKSKNVYWTCWPEKDICAQILRLNINRVTENKKIQTETENHTWVSRFNTEASVSRKQKALVVFSNLSLKVTRINVENQLKCKNKNKTWCYKIEHPDSI